MLAVNMDTFLELTDAMVLHAIPELDKYWAFNIESGDQYTLNDSAFFLLAVFREQKEVRRAIAEFAVHYDVNLETAEEDALPLLNDYYGLKFFKGEENEK